MLKIRQSAAWLALAGLLISGTCAAGSDIPNLVGTWTVQSEGGVLALPGGPRANIHHQGESYHHVTPTDTVIGIGIWTRKQ